MNKRLSMLEKITGSEGADAFAWYGLAMEYRREKRNDDALAAFETLRSRFPDYLPAYLMAGQALLSDGRKDDARAWLQAGRELAQTKGDDKTLSELEDALSECD